MNITPVDRLDRISILIHRIRQLLCHLPAFRNCGVLPESLTNGADVTISNSSSLQFRGPISSMTRGWNLAIAEWRSGGTDDINEEDMLIAGCSIRIQPRGWERRADDIAQLHGAATGRLQSTKGTRRGRRLRILLPGRILRPNFGSPQLWTGRPGTKLTPRPTRRSFPALFRFGLDDFALPGGLNPNFEKDRGEILFDTYDTSLIPSEIPCGIFPSILLDRLRISSIPISGHASLEPDVIEQNWNVNNQSSWTQVDPS